MLLTQRSSSDGREMPPKPASLLQDGLQVFGQLFMRAGCPGEGAAYTGPSLHLAHPARIAMNAPDRLPGLDAGVLQGHVDQAWDAQIVPELDYVDMDGAALLAVDIASGVVVEAGRRRYPERPGTGVELFDGPLALDEAAG